MRIAFLIRISVVDAMRGHPQERPSLHGGHSADGKEVLEPLRSSKPAMRQQPVIAYPDSQAARHPVQKQRNKKRTPTEKEKRGHCSDVEQHHERCDQVVDLAALVPSFRVKPKAAHKGVSV